VGFEAQEPGKGLAMELTVLTVPGCPNGTLLEHRLTEALAGRMGVTVVRQVIDDPVSAARSGMHGSPTLLVDGVDPFAGPGTAASVSCRLYRGADGLIDGAPPVEALRRALEGAKP
jgi:hypothetical protein